MIRLLSFIIFGISLGSELMVNQENKIDIVRNSNHIITYECLEDDIVFTFDLIGDITNNLNQEWPHLDNYRVWVDYNQNNELDSLIDKVFAPLYGSVICKAILLDQRSSTTCHFDASYTGSERFGFSENLDADHIIFEMTIPKNELSDKGGAAVYFEIFDGAGEETCYPRRSRLFQSTFKLDCNPDNS